MIGNLEDLPLLDILQIVSFSRKTGYLTIQTAQGEGGIVFSNGLVVSSYTWDSLPVDPRSATLSEAKREMLVRNRIAMALEQLIRLREGQFNFSLTEDVPKAVGGRSISAETLREGINPQELLLDLARGIDEDRRDSSAVLEASFAQPTAEDPLEDPASADAPDRDAVAAFVREARAVSAPTPASGSGETIPVPSFDLSDATAPEAAPPAPSGRSQAAGLSGPLPAPPPSAPAANAVEASAPAVRTILLVDDEEDVRRVLGGLFSLVGYDVVEAMDPVSAAKQAQKLARTETPFLVITDLGMPTSGGSSYQGGFEVVKRLWRMSLRPPVLMMAESLDPSLQARARQMGVANFVFKPGLAKLDSRQFEADLRAFASKLIQDVLPSLARGGDAASPPARARPALEAPPAPAPTAEDLSRDLSMIERRLDELRRRGDASQIAALVMQVAREFFERAILFLVKNDELRGLGGFGRVPRDRSMNLLVRGIVIPLAEPSAFRDVVAGRRPFLGPVPEGKWTRNLMARIGPFQSRDVALMPLLTHREPVALLFGDNPETGREVGRLDALAVFINQAGVALENAFLQRKLQALQGP